MNNSPPKRSIGYFAAAIILVSILVLLLAYNSYFRWELGYTMILVGLIMLVVSLLMGGLGIVFSLRAYSCKEPIGLWLFSTALAFVLAITYIFLVVKQFFP